MYPTEIRETIIERLAENSLNRLCRDDGMPDRRTVERWMDDDPDFAAKCARAREAHAERIFDSLEDVEDGVLSGVIKPDAARVVVASRQWRAEKLKPKKFGVKADVTLGGTIGLRQMTWDVVDTAETPQAGSAGV